MGKNLIILLLLNYYSYGIISINKIDFPDPNIVGKYGNNASCVAISPNCILTTCHQGTSTKVYFNNVEYNIIKEHRINPYVDLRICKIDGKLDSYVRIYSDCNEVGLTFYMAGYGKSSNDSINESCYTWEPNNKLIFGQDTVTNNNNSTLASRFVTSAMTQGDSGGPWLIEKEGKWYVIGLNQSVQRYGKSCLGDYMCAVRVSSFSKWIKFIIYNEFYSDYDLINFNLKDWAKLCN